MNPVSSDNKQQTTNNKQQTTHNKQQTTNNDQQPTTNNNNNSSSSNNNSNWQAFSWDTPWQEKTGFIQNKRRENEPYWLVVSTPLKNINQWEGLSHILIYIYIMEK